jgi:hypothetical protein
MPTRTVERAHRTARRRIQHASHLTLTPPQLDLIRLAALRDYSRGKLNEVTANDPGQRGRVYRAALASLCDQDESNERRIKAATTAASGGKLTLPVGTEVATLETEGVTNANLPND